MTKAVRQPPNYHNDMQQVQHFLRTLDLFANLRSDELQHVMALMKPDKIAKAKFVVSLAAHSELDLFLLLRGQASSRKLKDKYVDDVQVVYKPGDVMNLEAFVAGKDSAETIEALTELEVRRLSYDDFLALLDQQPELKNKLKTLPDVTPFWARQKRYPFKLDKGEVMVMYRRKHWYVLLMKLVPVILMVLTGLLLWRLPVFMPQTAPFATLAVVGVWLFITFLLAIWQINDWADDFYAVTNRRVVHRERILFFSNRQAEAPISQIRSIVASRTSFVANTLMFQNMGDVNIETMNSFHPISFANIDQPEAVSREILKQSQQAKIAVQASQRDVIRNILREQMNIVERPGNVPKPGKVKVAGYGAPPEEGPPPPKPSPLIVGNFFFPRSRVKDEKGNITYRRHPLKLLQTAGLPMLSILAYLLAMGVAWWVGVLDRVAVITLASLPFRLILIGLAAGIFLVLVVWFILRYEDWRNDMFLLTKNKIIDIDRTPFGLQGVRQNESPLDKVQNVTSDQKGFLAWLFNMGDVTIETGGDKHLIFEHVKDPRQIQRDIADYLSQLKADEKAANIEQRNKELAEWISIYNEMLNLPYDRKTFKQEK